MQVFYFLLLKVLGNWFSCSESRPVGVPSTSDTISVNKDQATSLTKNRHLLGSKKLCPA